MPYLDSFGPEFGDVKHLRVCLIPNLGAEIAAIRVSGDTHARFKNRYTCEWWNVLRKMNTMTVLFFNYFEYLTQFLMTSCRN